ncbi:hypothetical protein GCM10010402_22310 [Actinomadura luteofluorescens]|uniref:hypothetical protein n=1 Tax=Actinomadura luteofluorescens TaxID=46163 RepID=UPI002164067C|nr:hypothetical protein [Actinomadura glauciflava]MCR3743869.1 hypothetical protein [Actinomadura glauciflava]
MIPQRERITFLVLLADVLAYSRHGAWWLYHVHSGELIGPANDLAAAARQIRNQMEVAAAA